MSSFTKIDFAAGVYQSLKAGDKVSHVFKMTTFSFGDYVVHQSKPPNQDTILAKYGEFSAQIRIFYDFRKPAL